MITRETANQLLRLFCTENGNSCINIDVNFPNLFSKEDRANAMSEWFKKWLDIDIEPQAIMRQSRISDLVNCLAEHTQQDEVELLLKMCTMYERSCGLIDSELSNKINLISVGLQGLNDYVNKLQDIALGYDDDEEEEEDEEDAE